MPGVDLVLLTGCPKVLAHAAERRRAPGETKTTSALGGRTLVGSSKRPPRVRQAAELGQVQHDGSRTKLAGHSNLTVGSPQDEIRTAPDNGTVRIR